MIYITFWNVYVRRCPINQGISDPVRQWVGAPDNKATLHLPFVRITIKELEEEEISV
jgi:hypothetical protein